MTINVAFKTIAREQEHLWIISAFTVFVVSSDISDNGIEVLPETVFSKMFSLQEL